MLALITLIRYNKYGGNLIFYVSNVSEIDSVYIEIYVDNKLVDRSYREFDFIGYELLSFKSPIGKRYLSFKAYDDDDNILAQEDITTFIFMKWVIVEFQSFNIFPLGYDPLEDYVDSIYSTCGYEFMIDERLSPLKIIL